MVSRPIAALGILILLLAAAACGDGSQPTTNGVDDPLAITEESSRIAMTPDQRPLGVEESHAVERAISFLANHLGVPEEQIDFVDLQPMGDANGRRGCLEEEQNPTETVTPGREILLEAQGQVFALYSDLTGNFSPCIEVIDDESTLPGIDPIFKDGNPNQPRDDEVIIRTPASSK